MDIYIFKISKASTNRIIICFWNYIDWNRMRKGWIITYPVKLNQLLINYQIDLNP